MNVTEKVLTMLCWHCKKTFPAKVAVNEDATPYFVNTIISCLHCDTNCRLILTKEQVPTLLVFRNGKRTYIPDIVSLEKNVLPTEKIQSDDTSEEK